MVNGTLTTATKQFSEEVLINRVLINRGIKHPDDVIDVTLVGSPGASKEESIILDATKNNLFDTRYTFTEYHATFEIQLYIENGGSETPLVESVTLIENTRGKNVTGLTWTAGDLDSLAQDKNNVVYNNTSDQLVLDNTIPDRVVSRTGDNNANTDSFNVGLKFTTSQEWGQFQAKISANHNTGSDSTLEIDEVGGVNLVSKDISGNVAGDVITVDVSLNPDSTYYIYDKTTNSRSYGFNDFPTYPYTSNDGDLSITAGYQNGSEFSGYAFAFVKIGNINL